ncbi:nucleoside deaminase [Desulfobulbus sp. AH-315-M07]|nr:nucleoside deaminase [Desulfobulbus sp. AH-315-M07]
MQLALAEARAAAEHNDVPIGAVLVDREGTVVARGHNRREIDRDPSAHAEIVALRAAGQLRGQWRLPDLTMVVTLEPCPMCAGALLAARIERLVYACLDPKAGAIDSLFVMGRDPRLSHRFDVKRGVLAEPCADLLRGFFNQRR